MGIIQEIQKGIDGVHKSIDTARVQLRHDFMQGKLDELTQVEDAVLEEINSTKKGSEYMSALSWVLIGIQKRKAQLYRDQDGR